MKKFTILSVVLFLSLFLLINCGDDDDEVKVEESVTKKITSSSGGSVSTESKKANVEIPAGALSADTEVTVKPISKSGQPDEANLGSDVYEFGPSGTQFSKPVTISIEITGSVPETKSAKLAILKDNKWEAVSGSKVEGTKVSGQVTHFSKYVILFVDDQVKITSIACDSTKTFTACGGDLIGKWKMVTMCSDQSMGENPFKDTPECQNTVAEFDVDFSGMQAEFKSDGTYTMTGMDNPEVKIHYEIKKVCIDALVKGAVDADKYCASLQDSMGITCKYESNMCMCDGTMKDDDEEEEEENSDEKGTWSTKDNKITTSEDGETKSETSEYCVSGNKVVVKVDNSSESEGDNDGGPQFIIMEKM